MNKPQDNQESENETIRLMIQIGIVASCLVVITNNYSVLAPWFQTLLKLLALILAILSMVYIMLTGQKYGYKNKKDSKLRERFYSLTISFFWVILFMMVFLFSSDFISYQFGISFTQMLAATTFVITTTLSIYLAIKYS